MALEDLNTDRVPTPPYRTLGEAQAAMDELVTLIADLVPVALDDVVDAGWAEIDGGVLNHMNEPDERPGNQNPARVRARRMFARKLVERLLSDDDVVIYPVPLPLVDPSGRPVLMQWGGEPVHGQPIMIREGRLARLIGAVNTALEHAGSDVGLVVKVEAGEITGYTLAEPQPAEEA